MPDFWYCRRHIHYGIQLFPPVSFRTQKCFFRVKPKSYSHEKLFDDTFKKLIWHQSETTVYLCINRRRLKKLLRADFSYFGPQNRDIYLDQWFSTFFGWRHTFHQKFFCGTPKTRKISKMTSKNFSFCIKLLGFETWLLHTIPVFVIFETKMINSC